MVCGPSESAGQANSRQEASRSRLLTPGASPLCVRFCWWMMRVVRGRKSSYIDIYIPSTNPMSRSAERHAPPPRAAVHHIPPRHPADGMVIDQYGAESIPPLFRLSRHSGGLSSSANLTRAVVRKCRQAYSSHSLAVASQCVAVESYQILQDVDVRLLAVPGSGDLHSQRDAKQPVRVSVKVSRSIADETYT